MERIVIAEKNEIILNEIDCLTKLFKKETPLKTLIFCNLDQYPELGLDLRCLSSLGTPIIFYSFFKDLSYLEKQIWYCSDVDHFLKIPFVLSEFYEIFNKVSTVTITSALSKCLENCIKKKAELINRKIRHDFKNVIAAVRLLLGAFSVGAITLDTLNKTLTSLQANIADNNKDHIAILNQLALQSKKIRPIQTNEAFLSTGKVLIVDDHLNLDTNVSKGDFGWQYVYEAILTNNRFNYEIVSFDNYDAASRFIQKGIDNIEFAILDIDLGDDSKSGLHLLDEIRRTNPFTPVLMTTAHDDAKVTQLALELQADAYFVKELRDSKDRSSHNYYCKFREIIESFPSTSSKERSLYNEFKKKIPTIVEGDLSSKHVPRLEEGVVGHLTKLFLLLRAVDNHYSVSSLMSSHSGKNYDELLVILLDALLVRLNWDRQKIEDDDEPLTKLAAWQTLCEFYINKEGKILTTSWDREEDAISSAQDFFGYDSASTNGQPLSFLWKTSASTPSITETTPPPTELLGIPLIKKNTTSILTNLEFIPQTDKGKLKKYKVRVGIPDSQKSPLTKFAEEMQTYTAVRHGIQQNIIKDEVLEKLEQFLTLFDDLVLPPLEKQKNNTPNTSVITDVIAQARTREKAHEFGDHSIRSKMGAEALLLGVYLKNGNIDKEKWHLISKEIFEKLGKEEPFNEVIPFLEEECETKGLFIPVAKTTDCSQNILFIDDHGWDNGWFYVAQVCLNNSKLNCYEFKGANSPNFEDYLEQLKPFFMETDLVLLDLKMPEKEGQPSSENTGLKVAQTFRQWDAVTPIILLSAYYDSLIVKKAIKLGITNYFPKEIPNTDKQDRFKSYTKDFEDIIRSTLIEKDKDLALPRKKLKQAISDLENVLRTCEDVGSAHLPNGFINLVKAPSLCRASFELASMIKLSSPDEVGLKKAIINQVIRLLKQAIFFWQLPMEKYLYRWPEYFCDAENKWVSTNKKLRHQFLSYDQVWLNCGSIVEFVFNVVLIASGNSKKTVPAGSLKNDSTLKNSIIRLLGEVAYEQAINIWDLRNGWYHPTNPNRNPLEEYKETWNMLNKTIGFLTELKIIAVPIISQTYSFLDLHQNLKGNKQRQCYEEEISKKEKAKKQLQTSSAINAQQATAMQIRHDELEKEISKLKAECSTLTLSKILEERKTIVKDLASIPKQP